MIRNFAILALTTLIGVVPAGRIANPSYAAEGDPKLAGQAQAVLKKTCYRCHGQNGEAEGGFGYVLDVKQLVSRKKLVPNDPAKSKLLRRMEKGEMPPEDEKPRPDQAEIAIIKKWIEAGAPAFAEAGPAIRVFKGEKDILAAVRDHLRDTPDEDQKYQRYFTLTHLYNNPTVKDEDLRWYRAALSKVVNHLSWKPRIVIPRPIDKEETVYNVDMRDLGWDRKGLWEEVVRFYPYGLKFDEHRDEVLRKLAREVYTLACSDLPYLKGDWFVATASRPPLYHFILGLPTDAYDLERMLKVEVKDNFLRNRLTRAGFAKSGVSSQNRLIERHEAAYGAYWKSYDFKSNDGTSNLLQFPLGPVFHENPYPEQAFEHAGGELIFNLPNRLQGYLLVNNKDKRIDEGPTEIVSDTNKTGGTPAIVNGLSCMVCHKHGMLREGFKDEIRDGTAVSGGARSKVQKLYVREAEMSALLKEDEDRFVAALDQAMGRFLKIGADKDRAITDFTDEPVGKIARFYIKDLTLPDVACELGISDPKRLQNALEDNDRLRQLGMGALRNGGTVKRDAWSSLKNKITPFQRAAFELDRGSPHVSF